MNRRKCIGFLGGGQLARMSAYQAYKLGFNVAVLEKTPDSPAGQLTKYEFVGWVDDTNILKQFCSVSDVITLENEFVDYEKLEFIEELGKKVVPSSHTISLIQDKLVQKKTLRKSGIPVADFINIEQHSNYENISKILGSRFVLKSRKLGYDGYGNFEVKNSNNFLDGYKKLTERHKNLFAEKYVDFRMELAVMVVRNNKEINTYPVVQTIQENHICKIVIAPAPLSSRVIKLAKEISVETVKSVKGYGIFGVELFLTNDEEILVNEIAPRPHNSGHYTIEACVCSQFENHVRAVFNLPLGSTEMIKPNAVMVNLLGKKNGKLNLETYKKILNVRNLHLHLYGKNESRVGRKMGHLTLLGDKPQILKLAKQIEKKIII